MSSWRDALLRLRRALEAVIAVEAKDDVALAAEVERVVARLARVPDLAPARARPSDHPLTGRLEPSIAAVAAHFPDLAAALAPIADDLPWRYGYAPRADRPRLEDMMGWAEIVGPEAPFRSGEVCLGLTFIAAGTVYPAHRHPAIELYRVIAGRPVWTVAGRTFRPHPGDAILHAGNVDHAMTGGAEGLLAVYAWTGDVVSPSVWA
jgi:quercetin dioxygenase-like cupin family protein